MKLFKTVSDKVKGFAKQQANKGLDKVLKNLYVKKDRILLASKTGVKKTVKVHNHRLVAGMVDGKLVSMKLEEGTHLDRNKFNNPQDQYEITMSVSGDDFRKTVRNIRVLEDVKAIINGE